MTPAKFFLTLGKLERQAQEHKYAMRGKDKHVLSEAWQEIEYQLNEVWRNMLRLGIIKEDIPWSAEANKALDNSLRS